MADFLLLKLRALVDAAVVDVSVGKITLVCLDATRRVRCGRSVSCTALLPARDASSLFVSVVVKRDGGNAVKAAALDPMAMIAAAIVKR